MVLAGTGYVPGKEFTKRRIDAYTASGIDYRWAYTFEDLSPTFRASPLAYYFAELFSERNETADLQSILYQFQALQQRDSDDHYERIACPTIILTGTEDSAHQSAFELKQRIPGCELKILPGAGHACHIEQPWLFDRFMIEFLTRHGLADHVVRYDRGSHR
jgi:pimeloyl-ACP methyl ester carboxylesterase